MTFRLLQNNNTQSTVSTQKNEHKKKKKKRKKAEELYNSCQILFILMPYKEKMHLILIHVIYENFYQ